MDFLLDFILHIDQYMVMIVRDYHTPSCILSSSVKPD